MNRKFGFGLIEVMIASVVLGFLIVGLAILQKGNREAILRVRARDAANFVAQHVLDSLGAVGINSLVANGGLVLNYPSYTYYFEGKPQLDKTKPATKIPIAFDVKVALLDSSSSIDSTNFTKANGSKAQNTYAKSLEATVSWQHGNSTQSIKMAKVVR
ncbi:MAG: type II secretion system GspH family protein [Fibromonadales bacterium]|nr:type II secretion system GspH family protein [Fibromonadales bacterium]